MTAARTARQALARLGGALDRIAGRGPAVTAGAVLVPVAPASPRRVGLLAGHPVRRHLLRRPALGHPAHPVLRRSIRLLAALAIAGGALLAIPGTAQALPVLGGCTNPPTPEAPGQGISGFFLSEPNPLPPEEDPFAKGTKSTPFEQYGLAGLSWYAYDLGCGGAARDPSGAIGAWTARLLFIPAKAGVSALAAISQAALEPSYLSAFDPLLRNLTDSLHKAIFTPLFPLAVMLTGLLLMAQATRQRVSDSTTAIGWCLLVTVLAAALFAWPVRAGHAADRVIKDGVGAVASGISGEQGRPGNQVANLLYEPFLYRMWLMGEFCDPDSQGAKAHGSDLLQAQAFSWRQAQEARSNPDKLTKQKQDRFGQVAGDVKRDDPAAYECVAGHGSSSLEAAILSDVGVLLMAPFLLVGGLILIAAYLIIRFAVIFAPALLTAGAFYPLRGIVIAAGRVVAAAIMNGILFTLSVLLVIRVDGAILAPTTPLPGWLRLVLVGVVTVVMWYLTRPFRKLTTMVTTGRMASAMGDRNWYERRGGLLPWHRGGEPVIVDEGDTTVIVSNPQLREESRGPAAIFYRSGTEGLQPVSTRSRARGQPSAGAGAVLVEAGGPVGPSGPVGPVGPGGPVGPSGSPTMAAGRRPNGAGSGAAARAAPSQSGGGTAPGSTAGSGDRNAPTGSGPAGQAAAGSTGPPTSLLAGRSGDRSAGRPSGRASQSGQVDAAATGGSDDSRVTRATEATSVSVARAGAARAAGSPPPGPDGEPAVHRPRLASRATAASARSPAVNLRPSEGLYDPSADRRPVPEEDRAGYLHPVLPELDDAALYRLFDPAREEARSGSPP